MKGFSVVLAIVAAAAVGVQGQTTVSAACGTACPTGPAADVTVTRSDMPMPTGSSCPSLMVSTVSGGAAGAGNGTMPTGTGSPRAPAFTGAANHVAGSVGAALAVAAAAFAL